MGQAILKQKGNSLNREKQHTPDKWLRGFSAYDMPKFNGGEYTSIVYSKYNILFQHYMYIMPQPSD